MVQTGIPEPALSNWVTLGKLLHSLSLSFLTYKIETVPITQESYEDLMREHRESVCVL